MQWNAGSWPALGHTLSPRFFSRVGKRGSLQVSEQGARRESSAREVVVGGPALGALQEAGRESRRAIRLSERPAVCARGRGGRSLEPGARKEGTAHAGRQDTEGETRRGRG